LLKKIHVTGVVQGVGFRPFVYQLAQKHGLAGWVCNTSAGVDIEVEGASKSLAHFLAELSTESPPLAHIEGISATAACPRKASIS
jgi:hydrogenase maturation protein HypF